jgi:hypothetical protein
MRQKDVLAEGVGTGRGLRARLLRRRKAEQAPRTVAVPHAPPHGHGPHLHHGGQPRYRGNRTCTTKYTLLTFLPKSLFEQYRCGRRRAGRAGAVATAAEPPGNPFLTAPLTAASRPPIPPGASPTSTSHSTRRCR